MQLVPTRLVVLPASAMSDILVMESRVQVKVFMFFLHLKIFIFFSLEDKGLMLFLFAIQATFCNTPDGTHQSPRARVHHNIRLLVIPSSYHVFVVIYVRQLKSIVLKGGKVPFGSFREKWQNRILFIIAGNGLQISHHYETFTECRNEDSVAEMDTNSMFMIWGLNPLLALYSSIIIQFIIVLSDVDECTDSSHNCDSNAVCNNTVGSFSCSCKAGYSGDGVTCTGKYQPKCSCYVTRRQRIIFSIYHPMNILKHIKGASNNFFLVTYVRH